MDSWRVPGGLLVGSQGLGFGVRGGLLAGCGRVAGGWLAAGRRVIFSGRAVARPGRLRTLRKHKIYCKINEK